VGVGLRGGGADHAQPPALGDVSHHPRGHRREPRRPRRRLRRAYPQRGDGAPAGARAQRARAARQPASAEGRELSMEWLAFDSWIVAVGALCAVACALPGCFLLLRRMSMMGDAISHAVLPGLAIAFIATG